MALKTATFCISGTLSKGRKEVEAEIKKHGGGVAGSVTAKVTHLLCTPAEYAGKTAKVATAESKGIPCVKEDFLWDAIKGRKLPSAMKKYVFGSSTDASSAAGGKKRKESVTDDEEEPPAKKAKTAKKGAAVVNPKSGLEDIAVVYAEGDDIWDVEMIEKDDVKNVDKFYDMQVLYVDVEEEYVCFQHWGRTGTSGQVGKQSGSLEVVKKTFMAKFKEKSGYTWGEGDYTTKKAGKYTVLTRMVTDEVAHTWEYYVDTPVDGKRPGWYPYDDSAITNMERFFSQFKANPDMGPRYVFSGTWNYEVDFSKMHQMNVDHPNHTTRKIRRIKA